MSHAVRRAGIFDFGSCLALLALLASGRPMSVRGIQAFIATETKFLPVYTMLRRRVLYLARRGYAKEAGRDATSTRYELTERGRKVAIGALAALSCDEPAREWEEPLFRIAELAKKSLRERDGLAVGCISIKSIKSE